MDFFVGQKVVCVDDAPAPRFFDANGCRSFHIKKDDIYTISWIGDGWNSDIGNFPSVSLVGAEMQSGGILQKWHSRRFKPVEYKAMSVFRKIAQDVSDGKVLEIADV